MRLHVDLKSHLDGSPSIIQAEKTPEDFETASQVPVNGKYLIPVPAGLDFHVDQDSYVLDGAGHIDGGDVTSQGFAHLLAMFPQFGNVYFNPLLTADHLTELHDDTDTPAFVDRDVSPPVQHSVRFQTGRKTGGSLPGQMPTHTALLEANTTVTPNRPGLIVTTEIDIGPYTLDCDGNEAGADEFMLYWKLYDFEVTHDIAADYGAQAGTNEPAVRYVEEVDQEPTGFSAYISTNGGATWCRVGLLEPVAFCDKTTKVLVAFRNDTNEKIYMAHFGLLF